MKSHPLASQESQTGNSTPPANAAIYRRVRTATGCAFLATAVITSVCIFITALPLLPVLLVGITICTALASVFFWSIYRLKKLDEEPKKQQPPPEPKKAEIGEPQDESNKTLFQKGIPDASEIPGFPAGAAELFPELQKSQLLIRQKEQSGFGDDEKPSPDTQPTEISDVPKKTDTEELPNDREPGGQETVERTVELGLQTLQDPCDTPKTFKEGAGEIENEPEPPIDPPTPEPKTQDEEPPADTLKIADEPPPPDENPPAENEEVPQTPADQGAATLEQEAETALALKMRDAKDVNDPEVTEQLRTASALYFCGKQGLKFLFECAQSASNPGEVKTCFSASDIGDVWEKSGGAHHLYFAGAFPENFKIPRDKLPSIQKIIFESCEIEKFEFEEHFTGTFKELKEITFEGCTKLQYARMKGRYILFVNPNGYQELIKNQTNFPYIEMDNSGVLGHFIDKLSHGEIAITCHGKGTPSYLSEANNMSTISLAMPNVKTYCIDLQRCTAIGPRVALDLILTYGDVLLPLKVKFEHIKFAKPIDLLQKYFPTPSRMGAGINGR